MTSSESGLLRRTRDFFLPPPVSTVAELKAFVAGEAAYLAQKTVIGYCRVKTMLDYEKLLTEAAFRDGLEVCRWEAYAGTLGDTLILIEGLLRPAEELSRTTLADALASLYPALLDESQPAHRTDWQDRKEAFARRFALTRQAEPAQPDHVVEDTAALIHTLAPIHDRLKRHDLEIVLGDLRLHALAMHSAMLKRFRREALIRALTEYAAVNGPVDAG